MNTTNSCGQCGHYHRLGEEPRGYCCYLPPIPFSNGTVAQPIVQASRRACGQFSAGEPTVKEKQQPAKGK